MIAHPDADPAAGEKRRLEGDERGNFVIFLLGYRGHRGEEFVELIGVSSVASGEFVEVVVGDGDRERGGVAG